VDERADEIENDGRGEGRDYRPDLSTATSLRYETNRPSHVSHKQMNTRVSGWK